MSAPASDCVVLVPVGSSIEPDCEAGLVELERRGYQVRRVYGYAAIDQARNQIATDALREGLKELMWIDSDIGFSPDDVERLRALDLPISCGIYPKKGRRELACFTLDESSKLVFGRGGGVQEIRYAGTGFLHTRREVYETVAVKLSLPECNADLGRPLVPFFMPMVHRDGATVRYLPEDVAFCERARQVGYRIMADTRIRLAHIGKYRYGWEDAGGALQRFDTYTMTVLPPAASVGLARSSAVPSASGSQERSLVDTQLRWSHDYRPPKPE